MHIHKTGYISLLKVSPLSINHFVFCSTQFIFISCRFGLVKRLKQNFDLARAIYFYYYNHEKCSHPFICQGFILRLSSKETNRNKNKRRQ